jgi:DNA-binding transcriptional MerR regulator
LFAKNQQEPLQKIDKFLEVCERQKTKQMLADASSESYLQKKRTELERMLKQSNRRISPKSADKIDVKLPTDLASAVSAA